MVSDPDVPLGAQLFPRPVGFCSASVWEGVKIQTLASERTRTPTLIEVLTGLLTAETPENNQTTCTLILDQI